MQRSKPKEKNSLSDEEREARAIWRGLLLSPVVIVLSLVVLNYILHIIGFLSGQDWIKDLLEAAFDIAKDSDDYQQTSYGYQGHSSGQGWWREVVVVACATGATIAIRALINGGNDGFGGGGSSLPTKL
ncbi:MAG: hypothetical protein QM762_17860 [Chryseolinea sp.]